MKMRTMAMFYLVYCLGSLAVTVGIIWLACVVVKKVFGL